LQYFSDNIGEVGLRKNNKKSLIHLNIKKICIFKKNIVILSYKKGKGLSAL